MPRAGAGLDWYRAGLEDVLGRLTDMALHIAALPDSSDPILLALLEPLHDILQIGTRWCLIFRGFIHLEKEGFSMQPLGQTQGLCPQDTPNEIVFLAYALWGTNMHRVCFVTKNGRASYGTTYLPLVRSLVSCLHEPVYSGRY